MLGGHLFDQSSSSCLAGRLDFVFIIKHVPDLLWDSFPLQMAADREISLLTSGSTLSKVTRTTWSSQPAEEEEEEGEKPSVKFLPPEGGVPSPQLRCFESESPSVHEVAAESRPADATQARLSLSFDTSQMSVRSTDTTLEYYDAPLSRDLGGEEECTEEEERGEEVVTVSIKGPAEQEEPEEKSSPATEQTPVLTSEDVEQEEEEPKEEETFEDVMEIGLEQDANDEEEVQPEKENEQDVESSSKQDDAATLDQEETSSHNEGNSFAEFAVFVSLQLISGGLLHSTVHSTKCKRHMLCSDAKNKTSLDTFCVRLVCNQVTESAESVTDVESQDQPATATGQDAQSEATESAEFTEHLKLTGAAEATNELEEELEQSAGPATNNAFIQYVTRYNKTVVIYHGEITMKQMVIKQCFMLL